MNDNRSFRNTFGGGRLDSHIFNNIVSLENLFSAWKEFSRGKKNKPDVIKFSSNLEDSIFILREDVVRGRWKPDAYRAFYINDPKLRQIHKASVRDRMFYQAVYRVLYLLFDKDFVFDSYSSRTDKGTHAGIQRLQSFIVKVSHNHTRQIFALKCDIRKFFDSIDHSILLQLLEKKIKDEKCVELLRSIIGSFEKKPDKGLPLGNVTSQLFANVYLNPLDWYIKTELRAQCYVRYCDDFVVVSEDRNFLESCISKINIFLAETLLLELHPLKIEIRKLTQGIDFLGYVILPHRMVMRTKTKRRILKKSTKLVEKYKEGQISKEKVRRSIASYLGHVSHVKSNKARAILKGIDGILE